MAGHGMGPQGLGTCHSTLTLGCTNSALTTHTLLTNALLWLSHIPQTALMRGSLHALISHHSQPAPNVHFHPGQALYLLTA